MQQVQRCVHNAFLRVGYRKLLIVVSVLVPRTLTRYRSSLDDVASPRSTELPPMATLGLKTRFGSFPHESEQVRYYVRRVRNSVDRTRVLEETVA